MNYTERAAEARSMKRMWLTAWINGQRITVPMDYNEQRGKPITLWQPHA